ncbi:MAG: hypothetical protein ACM3X1_00605 [Ignavibacteriales bacterium]
MFILIPNEGHPGSGETDEVRKIVPIHTENEGYHERFHVAVQLVELEHSITLVIYF